MKTCLVIQSHRPGHDAQMFRAYTDAEPAKPLGVSSSTTGNEIYAVIKCGAKAFVKHVDPNATLLEIETRIVTDKVRANTWRVTFNTRRGQP
ncbi:MAG: hypothetical protein P4N60_11140 [Verrucomicrobiae bacterium]|nr:hypothetical protein [Verrucomicrobiae bacterium]